MVFVVDVASDTDLSAFEREKSDAGSRIETQRCDWRLGSVEVRARYGRDWRRERPLATREGSGSTEWGESGWAPFLHTC